MTLFSQGVFNFQDVTASKDLDLTKKTKKRVCDTEECFQLTAPLSFNFQARWNRPWTEEQKPERDSAEGQVLRFKKPYRRRTVKRQRAAGKLKRAFWFYSESSMDAFRVASVRFAYLGDLRELCWSLTLIFWTCSSADAAALKATWFQTLSVSANVKYSVLQNETFGKKHRWVLRVWPGGLSGSMGEHNQLNDFHTIQSWVEDNGCPDVSQDHMLQSLCD